MKRILVLAISMLVFHCGTAVAREGMYAVAYLSAVTISGSSSDSFDDAYFDSLKTGLGAGFKIGAGFSKYAALEGSVVISYHESDFLGLSNLDRQELAGRTLALKVTIPVEESKIEPFIFVGRGTYEIGDSSGAYYKGKGKEMGLGADIYVEPEVSLNAGLTIKKLTFDKGRFYLDSRAEAEVISLDIGIVFYFL